MKTENEPKTWHVNGIDSFLNRITGDETSVGWDKLHINGENRTIAVVFRPQDARSICEEHNRSQTQLKTDNAALQARVKELEEALLEFRGAYIAAYNNQRIPFEAAYEQARKALADKEPKP